MKFSLNKVFVIARREYLTTVRRPAFVISLVLTPMIFFLAGIVGTKMQVEDAVAHASEARVVAVVDSTGLFANAPLSFDYTAPIEPNIDPRRAGKPLAAPRHVPVILRRFSDQEVALDSLNQGHVKQVLVVGADFLKTGRLRLYEHDTRVFASNSNWAPLEHWLTQNLLVGKVDSIRIERTMWMERGMDSYTQDHDGNWGIKDDARQITGFLLPFALGFLLAMAIITGGQYLLQGVSEEKETRILESLLCSVSPDELLAGKLFGLGSAGLTLVGVWTLAGAFTGGGMLALAHVKLPPSLLVIGFLYFLLGYLFYSSIMLSVGALTSNLREATQYSGYLTILNVCPFWIMWKFLNTPNSGLAVGMSLFPPTAATSMMLRMSAASVSGAVIPPWQIATSLGLLGLSAVLMLMLGSRLFRLGMLLYGKTPNLPEIMRILRQS
jgi:ABC-2 type transport system permease protein